MDKYNQYGLTLMELMVTLTIAGIVLGLAVPGMRDFIRNERLTTTTNMLLTDLMLARSESVKNNQFSYLCVSSTQSSCTGTSLTSLSDGWLVYVDVNGDGSPTADEIIKVQQPITNVRFNAPNSLGNSIQFDRRGFSPASIGQISICDTPTGTVDAAKSLSISRTGRVSRGAAPQC